MSAVMTVLLPSFLTAAFAKFFFVLTEIVFGTPDPMSWDLGVAILNLSRAVLESGGRGYCLPCPLD